ncbi:MAG: hypothetical protein E7324_07835 [Clostridiales bacterium]|nr:hypothetical protein [Clostridiales bacterium]
MKKLLSLVLFLCLAALLPVASFAEEAIEPAVVFAEDFEDGEHEIVMMHTSGEAAINVLEEDGNKYLQVIRDTGDGDNGFSRITFGPEVRNFDYTVKVRPHIKNPDWNCMYILYRGNDQAANGGRVIEEKSYENQIWEWRITFSMEDMDQRIVRTDILVENQDFWFDNDVWYEIKVEARENNIKVYVDGELATEWTDELDLNPKGIFGFTSWGASYDIDDIEVISYDPPKTEEEVTEEVVEEVASKYAKNEKIDLIPLVESEVGRLEKLEDGSMWIKGFKDEGGDDYVSTWHILQEKVKDFELEFTYTPNKTAWNTDRFSFRCAGDENEWNQYMVIIRGSAQGDVAGVALVKGESLAVPFGMHNMTFEAGKAYNFKLIMKGAEMVLQLDGETIIEATLPTEETEDYHDKYIPEGDFQIVTWGGDFVVSNYNVTILDPVDVEITVPEVADEGPAVGVAIDLLPLVQKESGELIPVENGLWVKGRSDAGADQYSQSWHILQKKLANFELAFDYIPARVDWTQDRISFRCEGPENEWGQYMVLLNGTKIEGKNGVMLVKGEALNEPFGYYPMTFEAGQTYSFVLTAIDNVFTLALNGEEIISATLSTEETDVYRDIYIPAGDFQIVTWGGDFVLGKLVVTPLAAE